MQRWQAYLTYYHQQLIICHSELSRVEADFIWRLAQPFSSFGECVNRCSETSQFCSEIWSSELWVRLTYFLVIAGTLDKF